MWNTSPDRGKGEVGTPFPGRLCEVLAQTEPATGIESSTVYVKSEASSPSVVDKVSFLSEGLVDNPPCVFRMLGHFA
eukprot:2333671-Amphidinium_carterae.1